MINTFHFTTSGPLWKHTPEPNGRDFYAGIHPERMTTREFTAMMKDLQACQQDSCFSCSDVADCPTLNARTVMSRIPVVSGSVK